MSTDILAAVSHVRRSLARAAGVAFPGAITARHGSVLREVRAFGETSQVQLARATATDPSLLVRVVDELERQGLVQRRRSESDRREVLLSLTAAGKRALSSVDAAWARLESAASRDLTAAEREAFVAISAKMHRSLDALTQGDIAPAEASRGER